MVDIGEGCGIMRLDYCRTIDTVPHVRLFEKRETVGIPWKFLHLIESFLRNA